MSHTNLLENTLITTAEQWGRELRSDVARGPSEYDEEAGGADMWKHSVLQTVTNIQALAHIAHIQDSGLSEAGSRRLLELEQECLALLRTFGWLSGRP